MGPTLQADVSGAGTEARDLPSPRGPPSPRPSEQSSGALAPSLLGTSSQAQVQPDAHSGALAKPLIPQTPLLYLYPHDIRRGTQMLALYRSLIFSALTLGGIQGGPLVLSCLAWGGGCPCWLSSQGQQPCGASKGWPQVQPQQKPWRSTCPCSHQHGQEQLVSIAGR